MKNSLQFICLVAALALLTIPVVHAQTTVPGPDTEVEPDKRGQTGFKFLTVSVDPRAAGMGDAITATRIGSSTSLFYNPASMATMESDFHVRASILEHIVDINYNVASVAYRPLAGQYGVIGLSFTSVDYGEFFETVRAQNDQGFIELGSFSPSALAAGLGYAKSITDRFSVGAHVKYTLQDLGSFAIARGSGSQLPDGSSATFKDYSLNTLAVDFGVLYRTGFRSLTIGMSTRNFAPEMRYERERFELPLTFQLGASMDLIDLTSMDPSMHSLEFAVDAQRPRDFAEHVKFGAEYTFMNLLSLRGGISQAFVGDDSEEGFSIGGGLQYEISGLGVGADYAYTDFGVFGSLNRFALQVSF